MDKSGRLRMGYFAGNDNLQSKRLSINASGTVTCENSGQ
eukprot:SAG31_NODE_39622_length_287_cov_0.484043_2_plen_38_part_01